MRTLRRTAVLTQQITDFIEVSVPDDACEEDIEQEFAEEADKAFHNFTLRGANVISFHIEFQGEIEEE